MKLLTKNHSTTKGDGVQTQTVYALLPTTLPCLWNIWLVSFMGFKALLPSSCSWWESWSKLAFLSSAEDLEWKFCPGFPWPVLLSPLLSLVSSWSGSTKVAVPFLPLLPCFSTLRSFQGYKVASPGRKSWWPLPTFKASLSFKSPLHTWLL